MMSFIYFILIGAVSGWLAGKIWRGSGFGVFGNIVVGILGGILGGWVAGFLGFSAHSLFAKLIVSTAGAWLLLFIISAIKGRR
jgi:uncharacterized membrane protein YeaQ/YmgE (transglycosylase-associated protein family)